MCVELEGNLCNLSENWTPGLEMFENFLIIIKERNRIRKMVAK